MERAPPYLRNAVPVDALYEPALARQVAPRNLLQREGYGSLDAVRAEGEALGALAWGRARLRALLACRAGALETRHEAAIDACEDLSTLERWLDRALTATSADEVLGG